MTLKTIAIENIKGIKKKCFNLDILPNKPSILVAPNGFGKSSLAAAFNLLQTDRLIIDEYSLHEYDNKNRPKFFIKYEKPDNITIDLEASDLVNTIKDHFDYFVINSQVGAKGTGVNYGSKMIINPVTLVDEVPEKVKFNYSLTTQKQRFGSNSKVLPNITPLLANLTFIKRVNEEISILENALENQIQQKINKFIDELNRQVGTSQDLIKWIETDKIEHLSKVNYLSDLAQIIRQFNCFGSIAKNFLASIQLIDLYNNNKADFKNACRYKVYELEKQNYKEILKSFNASWKEVILKESRGKLIVEFPEFYSISNGERDTLSFVALLEKARRSLRKNSNILVIDEVFDYLDDANLIAVQYYITEMIEEYRLMGRRIYPLILTHLDPNYFRNFAFSKQKIYYLYDWKLKVNQSLIDLLCKRDESSIRDDISRHLFHFHPSCINKRLEFRKLSLKETWGEGQNFDDFINKEVKKYLNRETEYDPFAICCAIRKRIEKFVYEKIQDVSEKEKFLNIHTTRKKLDFAEEIGVSIPEIYYLLGIIYNDGLHWKHGQDNVSQVASRLENWTIRHLIKVVFSQ
ncbi:hypothetical protein H6F93_01995 [Leptolyngbya sp. FACHB-671]|uniref:hypothetical protein n=1 Tax=Leptolyngbya sp. FACHB-671 TaxID=2692812 RepID=UPI00168700D1|nr:hypothetical protein [Leptolyngbya sp. FACHB-671]MBD2066309.1 hypothetical protein [Leptolyngbya sp. FACHB-671]